MRIARYKRDGQDRLAVLDGEDLVDLVEAGGGKAAAFLNDTTAFIAAGDQAIDLAGQLVKDCPTGAPARRKLASVELASPIMPSVVLCSGENYWDHREEKPQVEGKEPEFFLKTPLAVIGPRAAIILDRRVTRKLDYETELLIIIGRPGRHIAPERALEHVFGFSIMNDVTARDRQVKIRPDGSSSYALGPGKNFDTSAPIGPWIVTRDEIPDPQALTLRTHVNSELRQHNTTGKMIWTVAQLIAFFSAFYTLRPGVVISTGTPGGTAWGTDRELGGRFVQRGDIIPAPGYLQPGDVVRCEISGIGTLENHVVEAT
jgi:2-keto-4-pentenoate hydratase/2-oxohepta-3-ene-1,7-dioic acid hydratase in catechol pathway